MGSVYDVFNLGDGIENVYTAIPGADGAADTVTDTLVTPWGDLNLDSLVAGIDAASALDPGAPSALVSTRPPAAPPRPPLSTRWPSSVCNEDQRTCLNSTTEHPRSLGAWDVRRLRPWLLSLPSKVGWSPHQRN